MAPSSAEDSAPRYLRAGPAVGFGTLFGLFRVGAVAITGAFLTAVFTLGRSPVAVVFAVGTAVLVIRGVRRLRHGHRAADSDADQAAVAVSGDAVALRSSDGSWVTCRRADVAGAVLISYVDIIGLRGRDRRSTIWAFRLVLWGADRTLPLADVIVEHPELGCVEAWRMLQFLRANGITVLEGPTVSFGAEGESQFHLGVADPQRRYADTVARALAVDARPESVART